MLELNTSRKNKINLADYNYSGDIANRSLLASLSFFEHDVLQEIFFSPLKISCKKLARNLGCEEGDLSPFLLRLSRAGLLTLQDDTIVVDKEMRKYFEFHMKRFEPDFRPDMEYIQGILRKAPIHILPTWYAIPRTSNNIFESIVERYLVTPQLFQRYIGELQTIHPAAYRIMRDVFSSPDLKISSEKLIEKHNLTRSDFEEALLFLEFSFACCVVYTRGEHGWLEFVTPFYEWSEYLRFFHTTDVSSIQDEERIERTKKNDFAFAEDLSVLLHKIKVDPLPLPLSPTQIKQLTHLISGSEEYLALLQEKLLLVQLAVEEDGAIKATEQASDFLNSTSEQKALYLYRHPLNRIVRAALSPEKMAEKNIREAEKSIKRVLRKGWVFFDEFLKGVAVPLKDDMQIALKRSGKSWSYSLPSYTEEDRAYIKTVLYEWLFEAGIISYGKFQDRDCFTVTPFGRFFFEE